MKRKKECERREREKRSGEKKIEIKGKKISGKEKNNDPVTINRFIYFRINETRKEEKNLKRKLAFFLASFRHEKKTKGRKKRRENEERRENE